MTDPRIPFGNRKSHPLRKSLRGASLSEYGLLAGLVAVVSISTVAGLGDRISDSYASVGAALSSSGGSPAPVDEPAQPEAPDPLADYSATESPSSGTSDTFFYAYLSEPSRTMDNRNSSSSIQDTLVLEAAMPDDVQLNNPNIFDMTMTFPDNEVLTIDDQNHGLNRDGFGTVVFADGSSLDRRGLRDRSVADQMDAGGTVRGSDISEDYLYDVARHGNVHVRNHNYSSNTQDALTIRGDGVDDADFILTNAFDMRITFSDGETMMVEDIHHGNDKNGFGSILFEGGPTLSRRDIRDKAAADGIDAGSAIGSDILETWAYSEANDPSAEIRNNNWSSNVHDILTLTDVQPADVSFININAFNMEIRFSDGEVLTIHDQQHGTYEYGFHEIVFSSGERMDRGAVRDRAVADAMKTSLVIGSDMPESYFYRVAEHGTLTVRNFNHSSSVQDRLTIEDALASQVQFIDDGSGTLTIQFADGDAMTVERQFYADNKKGFGSITFQDGAVLDRAGISSKAAADTP